MTHDLPNQICTSFLTWKGTVAAVTMRLISMNRENREHLRGLVHQLVGRMEHGGSMRQLSDLNSANFVTHHSHFHNSGMVHQGQAPGGSLSVLVWKQN